MYAWTSSFVFPSVALRRDQSSFRSIEVPSRTGGMTDCDEVSLTVSIRKEPNKLEARIDFKIIPYFVGVNSAGLIDELGILVHGLMSYLGVVNGAETELGPSMFSV